MTRSRRTRFSLLATLFTLVLLAISINSPAQEKDASTSLGNVEPVYKYEQMVIAIPAFGRAESAPLDFETMPRIIRRDLELSGFFAMPSDQRAVNSLNVRDVAKKTVSFDQWKAMGVDNLLMADISVPSEGVLRARVLLYDIDSQKLIISRNIDGRVDDVRGLAHRISDEVVKMLVSPPGIAQTQLIFINEQIPGIKEVSIMDADGFNQKKLTNHHNICTTPEWGSNGTELYYTSYHGNRANVYGKQLSTGKSWTIAGYGGTNHSPAWNQRKKRLLMVLSKDGGSEIYSSDRLGQDLKRITQTKANEASPVWSPDGSKVAFTSDEGGTINIYIANADGSGKRRLTHLGSWNDAPSWSPDGQWIAFVSRNNGVFDIFAINQNGDPSTVRRLTKNQGNNESPSWAPDGRHVAFSSDRSGQWQIYMMLDDGSNQRPLTTSGKNTQPSWGPAPSQ